MCKKAHSHRNKHTDSRSALVSTTLCVSVYTSKGLALEQEPDKCGLSRASLSLSHLPFHSVVTLVLMRRQGLTYIHPLTGTTTPTSTTSSPTHTPPSTSPNKGTGIFQVLSDFVLNIHISFSNKKASAFWGWCILMLSRRAKANRMKSSTLQVWGKSEKCAMVVYLL